jgi:predicted metalloenzyme YecM
VYLFGKQNQETVSKLNTMQEQLKEIKTNQALLTQAITDIAVIKVRQETQAQALSDLRSQYGKR